MATLSSKKSEYISQYKQELRRLLSELDVEYRPSSDKLEEIIEYNVASLDVDDLLLQQFVGEENKGLLLKLSFPHQVSSLETPLAHQLGFMSDIRKAACILAHMVIATAILVAWVASGGTLIIGTSIAGVVITEKIYVALVGGIGGRALAEKFC